MAIFSGICGQSGYLRKSVYLYRIQNIPVQSQRATYSANFGLMSRPEDEFLVRVHILHPLMNRENVQQLYQTVNGAVKCALTHLTHDVNIIYEGLKVDLLRTFQPELTSAKVCPPPLHSPRGVDVEAQYHMAVLHSSLNERCYTSLDECCYTSLNVCYYSSLYAWCCDVNGLA